MTRATGQNAIELARDGPDSFFTRGVDARLVFHRKDDGTIDSVTLHQILLVIVGALRWQFARLPAGPVNALHRPLDR